MPPSRLTRRGFVGAAAGTAAELPLPITPLPANVRVTHRSLFDGTNQGIALTDALVFGLLTADA